MTGTAPYLAGMRQTLRAIRDGRAVRVLVAADAAASVRAPVEEAARAAGLPVEMVATMRTLGRTCGIAVGCACAAQLAAPGSR